MEQRGVHFLNDATQRQDSPTSGQLGLTLFNPLGHLESPR